MDYQKFEEFKKFYNDLWAFHKEGIAAIQVFQEIKDMSKLFQAEGVGTGMVERWSYDFVRKHQKYLDKNPQGMNFVIAVSNQLKGLSKDASMDKKAVQEKIHNIYGIVFDMLKTYGFWEERISDDIWTFIGAKASKQSEVYGNTAFAKAFIGAMLEELDTNEKVLPALDREERELEVSLA